MQMHKNRKSYHVSYANNICVSLLHASSNKTLPIIFTFVLLLIHKQNKAYNSLYNGIGELTLNSNREA